MLVPMVLFAIAAVGGLVLLGLRLRNENPPLGIALVHGAVAAAGLIALALPVVSGRAAGSAKSALVLFVIAALGGFFLLSIHLRKRLIPVGVVAVHALVAVAAFGLLLFGAFGAG